MLVDLAELETGENAAGLEHAMGFAQRGGDVAKVADSKGDGVEVYRGGGDSRSGRRGGGGEEGGGACKVFGVGFDEGEGGLLRGGQGGGALFADGKHGGVDIADGDAHGWVRVECVGGV